MENVQPVDLGVERAAVPDVVDDVVAPVHGDQGAAFVDGVSVILGVSGMFDGAR